MLRSAPPFISFINLSSVPSNFHHKRKKISLLLSIFLRKIKILQEPKTQTHKKKMGLTKIIVIVALTFAITIAMAMKTIDDVTEEKPSSISSSTTSPKDADHHDQAPQLLKVSRFLKEEGKKPRPPYQCNKDEKVCYVYGGKNSTCCNNKCVDLATDSSNCGACKRNCKFRQVCCGGECVDIAFDKRHCGACNHRCNPGENCVYGMCNYA